MRTAIYQHHPALDYLSASEGGVCGEFNLSNCCLQTGLRGDNRSNEENLSNPNLEGQDPRELFGEWSSTRRKFKTLIGITFLILGTCVILLCLAPLVLGSVSSLTETVIKRKTVAHMVMLCK